MTNQQIPSYSGVTINITNPTVNAGSPNYGQPQVITGYPTEQNTAQQIQASGVTNPIYQQAPYYAQNPAQAIQPNQLQQSYPPQYYLNNYNYQNNNPVPQNGLEGQEQTQATTQQEVNPQQAILEQAQNQNADEDIDLTTSQEIIKNINEQDKAEKNLEKNGKQTRVVSLTDEYIMSLENYLNNQNSEIRVMAAKEVLTRFDEDKSRYDDAALNALLNKMLQDPQKLVRVAALSALSSGLASGNDYTVELLNNIQQNPNSSKEDVVEAANILLKMSAETEVRYVQPNNNLNAEQQKKMQQQLIEQQKEIQKIKQSKKAE